LNWEAIGELAGAIGVAITLVYLACQIRQNTLQLEQNTLAAKAAAQNASNEALRETREAIFKSKDMAEIFFGGNMKPEELDEISMLRYRLIVQNVELIAYCCCLPQSPAALGRSAFGSKNTVDNSIGD
jgi:hypothetical protein